MPLCFIEVISFLKRFRLLPRKYFVPDYFNVSPRVWQDAARVSRRIMPESKLSSPIALARRSAEQETGDCYSFYKRFITH